MKNIIVDRLKNGEFVLIGEIGVNYYDIAKKYNISNIDAAKLMIDKAKESGMHAVKFQTYKASKIAAKNSPSYWDTKEEPTTSQYELFKKFDHFGYEEYKILSDYCNENGIEFLSTAFDFDSADYLDDLMNVFKISSSDLNNLPFVEHQAKKGKPILLSTGASEEIEIDECIRVIRKHNDQPIVILHCVLEYPTPLEHANLNKIITLKNKYPNLYIGYSDHTKPTSDYVVLKTAYNLGAQLVEKHYTLDKNIKGNDHFHSMDHIDAKNIIEAINMINIVRGSYDLEVLETERKSRKNARRSLVTTMDIEKGTVLTREMLTFKRPGNGISPSQIEIVLGKKTNRYIEEDTTLFEEMLDND